MDTVDTRTPSSTEDYWARMQALREDLSRLRPVQSEISARNASR